MSVRRLTRALAAIYRDRGRSYMDLSVTHDNAAAIALYEKLGFQRVPVMAVKRKNAINEPLFTHPPETVDDLNPYARIIADEAMRRGIWVEVLDAEARRDAAVARRPQRGNPRVVVGVHFRGGDEPLRRQAADPAHRRRGRASRCRGAGWPPSPRKTTNSSPRSAMSWSSRPEANRARASRSASTVPTNSTARWPGPASNIPRCSSSSAPTGDDLRLVVIDGKVVAAALRRPAEIVGTGHHTVRELIEAQSRRRAAATGGESRIPIDDVTEATVAEAGWSFDDVLPEGQRLRVRRTANLHQGGTIHDVTAEVHPELCRVAVTAAEAIGIPVTGIDLLVPDVTNDRIRVHRGQRAPGLANHEPQPTAAAFVDYLFPTTPGLPQPWTPTEAPE